MEQREHGSYPQIFVEEYEEYIDDERNADRRESPNRSFRTGTSRSHEEAVDDHSVPSPRERRWLVRRSILNRKESNPSSLKTPRRQEHASDSLPSSPSIESRSFIAEAAEHNNFEALREGLNFALGSSGKEPEWFPVRSEHKKVSDDDLGPKDIPSESPLGRGENYTDNIPLADLNPQNLEKMRSKSIESPFLAPFHDSSQLHSNSGNPFTSSHDDRVNIRNIDPGNLEAGEDYNENANLQVIGGSSPSKFSNILTRLSERVAGISPSSPTEKFGRKLSSVGLKRSSTSERGGGSDIDANEYGSDRSENYFNLRRERSPSVSVAEQGSSNEAYIQNPGTGGLGLTLEDRNRISGETQATSNKGSDGRRASIEQSIMGRLRNPNMGSFQDGIEYDKVRFKDQRSIFLFGKSLKLFSSQSRIRQACHKVLSHSYSNLSLLILLILQVTLLSYRQWNPHAHKGYYYNGYNWADNILMAINAIYTVETIARIIAYGLVDDHCMFEELNLPYPENEIKKVYFNYEFLKRLLELLDLSKLYSYKLKKANSVNSRLQNAENDLSEDIDIKEINLDEDGNELTQFSELNKKVSIVETDIQKKYNKDFRGSTRSLINEQADTIGLSEKVVLESQKFDVKSTFLLQKKTDKNMEKLHLKRAYLRNSWHRIDFLSVIFFWISLALSVDQYDAKHHIMLFRALSCLRILRLCNLTTGTSTILTACKIAIPQLIDVSIFISCFWLFFGIIGVQSFKSSLSRHCVWTNPSDLNDTYTNSDQFCGSYLELDGNALPYIKRDGRKSDVVKGFTCPKYSKCISGDNPYGGTVSFDNILQSLELVFVVMSANTFTDIMYDTMDSDNIGACLFFIFSVFILTVWLINVFIAVIVASFNITRMEEFEEKKQTKQGKKVWRIFGAANKDVSMHTERINALKKQNWFFKYYYKFEFIFSILILLDLVVQCFRHYGMSTKKENDLIKLEFAATVVFLLEIILRFAFHFPNWRLFFMSRRNCFDLFLAVITMIIIIDPIKNKLGHAYYWLSVFQLLRFYRVVLASSITRNLWLKIMGNFKAIFDLALFYFILTFLVSIIVARYFEGTIPEDEFSDVDFPVHTLPNAFIALYVITSTENWTEILYSMQQYAHTTSSRAFGGILLVLWFIVSNMIILNVFIAVIAKTLEVSEEGKRKQQLLQFIDNMTEKLQNFDGELGMLLKFKNKIFGKKGIKDELEEAVVNLLLSGTAVNDFLERDNAREDELDDTSIKHLPSTPWRRWWHVNFSRTNHFLKNPFYAKKKKKIEISNFDPANFAKKIINERNVLVSKQVKFLKENPNFNTVFYTLGPRHRLRRACQRLVKSSYGERIDGVEPNKTVAEAFMAVSFLVTIGLVVTACYLTPLYRKEMAVKYGTINWTFYLEVAFAIFFTLEFVIRIIADGLIFTPNAIMRSSWNLIDFIVLISLWIELIAFLKDDGNLSRIVRGFKALRALRLLTISETAKMNFHNTMISGFWKIINAALISLCLLFPFSIWGLNIFNGRLGYCIDGESYEKDCYNEYSNEVFNWNVVSPNVYQNPPLEFNRFITSFSTLFQMISLEGWSDCLLNVMKSTGIGTPQRDYASPVNGFFVVLFNFVSIVFILTLFVSVIISNYSKTTGRAYLTNEQISYYQVKKFLIQVKPSKRKNFELLSWFQKFCYSMTVERNPFWSKTLNVLLFLHVSSLLLECFPSYDGLDTYREVVFMIASLFFSANAIMLLIGQGPITFLRYKWNIFNLVVSCGAFLTTIISFFIDNESAFININKLFLVGILTFIIPRSNRLSELLRFASASLPSLISLSFTWIIVFLVFAIAMNQIFGLTKIGQYTSGNINLRSVTKALILLFKCSFGEGWNYIMVDFALESPFCSTAQSLDDSDCGNKQYAYILFMLWNIISMFIFLNMFISLIIDSFSYINNRSGYSHLIKREEIRRYKKHWQKFDPEGLGYIRPYQLPRFLHSMEGAFSFHLYSGPLQVKKLSKYWFKRNNPKDPYDITVNYDSIEKTLNAIDVPKIRERRKAYERFIEEAILTMELNHDPGISFTRILLQLPLYVSFEAGQCLNLIDFLEHRLLQQKVEKRLHTKKVHETIAAYACRWKYLKNKTLGIVDSNIDFGEELRRNSYLTNKNLEVNAPSIFVTDTASSPGKSYNADDEDEESFPLTRSSGFSGGQDEVEGSASGIYVPKSPIHVYRTQNKFNTNNTSGENVKGEARLLPKLSVQIPSLFSSAPMSPSQTSPLRDQYRTLSPFIDSSASNVDQDQNEGDVSLIDLSTIGETLENTEWEAALKEVRSERHTSNPKDRTKED